MGYFSRPHTRLTKWRSSVNDTSSVSQYLRCGRLGVGFVTVSAVCIWQGARIFLPDRQTKRSREMEIKRDARAEKEQVRGWRMTVAP